MANLPGLIIKISADTREASQALNRIDGKMSSFQNTMKGVAIAAAAAFSVDAIRRYATEAVNLASAFEQAEGAAQQLFGGAGAEKASEWAETTAANLGLSAVKAIEAQTAIGAFARQAGLAGEEAVTFTQDMVVAAADMAAAFGGDVQTAVEALGSAFRGSFNPIERYGILIKATSVDAEAAALGFEKIGNSFSAQAKVLATTSLIEKQNQMLGVVGQNAREADTYAGATQRLNAKMEDLQLTLGQGLLDGFGSVGQATGDFSQALDDLKPLVRDVGEAAGDFAKDLVFLGGKLASASGWIDDLLAPLEKADGAFGFVGDAVNRFGQSLRAHYNPVGYFSDAIRGLTGQTEDVVEAQRAAADANAALYAGYAANSARAKINAAEVLKLGSAYEKAAAGAKAFLDSTGNRVLYNTVAAQVRDINKAAKESEETFTRTGGAASKAAEEIKKLKDASFDLGDVLIDVDVKAKKANASLVDAYKDKLKDLENAAKAYKEAVANAIEATQKQVDDYRGSLNETFLGVNLDDFVTTTDDGTTIFDSAAFQQWLGDKEEIRKALSPMLGQIPQVWAEQILGMGNDAALATLNWITNSAGEVSELQRNMDTLALNTENTLTGPMSEAMRSTFWEAQQEGINAAKEKVKEEAAEFKKWVRSKLKTKITIDIEYREINSPPAAASSGGAVRQVQQFEALNGTSWRV